MGLFVLGFVKDNGNIIFEEPFCAISNNITH